MLENKMLQQFGPKKTVKALFNLVASAVLHLVELAEEDRHS